jgi:hypothetical protein
MAAHKIIDDLTIDHPKVKLPREVGEEFDKTVSYLKTEETDIDAFDYVAGILYDGDEWENHPNLSDWYNRTANAALILADAYRYGWEAEPEELFYVEAPENWDHRWAWKIAGSSFKGYVRWKDESELNKARYEQFTRAELKQYHLDSGIFTLVPVENEEVSQ